MNGCRCTLSDGQPHAHQDPTSKACIVCGLINPITAEHCECGFDFRRQLVVTPTREMSVVEVGSRTISRGIAVVAGGLIALGLQFSVMTGGANPDKFLAVYTLGALFTLGLGIHQIARGFVLRSRGKSLHPEVRY
jgi:hypothetical protein